MATVRVSLSEEFGESTVGHHSSQPRKAAKSKAVHAYAFFVVVAQYMIASLEGGGALDSGGAGENTNTEVKWYYNKQVHGPPIIV